ncbi:DUF2188 domain-containing protein [Citromicrobium bathyomarinum]|jgi:hypothetical protein|uniref:DUF2188 domain-containing protein n=1 Tax=Croceicoccus mobilis TaxID=1703339 RepID=A0A916ZBM9_9SPHN|nr:MULTISPECIES: DUF2188 domain-containing protein [Alphaproteobacteria]MBO79814.1 DUF2188 domain-containing protein [Citromicrobium sp.]PHR74710.1 MAG: DUF2188 domain-containing protein [Henriciella sp.]GGD84211.1 hypothetical protein GCM10010990_37880 [Croceicoccus mobilis]
MSKGPKSHHVVPNPSGGWDVKRGGASRASTHHDTKREAIDRGRDISRNQNSEFRIHNRDGKIARSDSHGNDPCPPKDRK